MIARMQGLRKPVAIAAATAMALALVAPGGAALAANQSFDKTSVTVNDLVQGDTVTAYRLASASVDADTNALSYSFESWLPESYNEASEFSSIADDSADAKTAADAIAASKATSTTTVTAAGSVEATSGTSATLSLDPGYYLLQVTATSGKTRVYQNMLVSTVPQANGSRYVAHAAESIDVKKSDVTQPVKTAASGKDDDALLGGTKGFTITTALPDYPSDATNATFVIGDAPTGMHIDTSTVKVSVAGTGLASGSDTYAVAQSGADGMTVTFAKAYLTANQNQSVTVTYDATLTSVSKDAGTASNSVMATFNSNPYQSGTSETDPSTVTEKTYGYVFTKTGKDGALADAVFTLYDAQGNAAIERSGADYTSTSDANGYVGFDGLAAGTYTLKETKVPAGYQALADFTFTVGADTATADNPATTDITESNYLVDSTTHQDPEAGALPKTGEMGTLALLVGGIALIAAGAAFVVRSRRRENRE